MPTLLFLPVVLAPPLNHDVAAVLAFSQRWLGGERLYIDLIDVNPPLIFVLNLLPAAIARVTGASPIAALQACILLWGAAAWRLTYLARSRDAEDPVLRGVLDGLPLIFLLGAGYDFGQREHLMAIAALPYAAAAAGRAAGARPRGFLAGAGFAAVGFALKPHFLTLPALIELLVLVWRWRRTGRLLPEVLDPARLVMLAVWAGFGVALLTVFSAYTRVVVPLALDLYVEIGGLSPWQVVLLPRLGAATVLLLLAAAAALRARRVLPVMLVACGLGALAAALAEHKGWTYHVLPVWLFATAALAVAVAGRMPAGRPRRRAAALLGAIMLYACAAGEAPWRELTYFRTEAAQLTRILQRHAPGARILVLSPGLYPIFPALNYDGATLTLRTMDMWILQGAYPACLPDGARYRAPDAMGRAEAFVFNGVADDFARDRPDAVLVDRVPGIAWCGSEFSFLDYFGRNPAFAAEFAKYRAVASEGRYTLYLRAEPRA